MRTILLFLYYLLILGSHDCTIRRNVNGVEKWKLTFHGWYDNIKRKRGLEKKIEQLTKERDFHEKTSMMGNTEIGRLRKELKEQKTEIAERLEKIVFTKHESMKEMCFRVQEALVELQREND